MQKLSSAAVDKSAVLQYVNTDQGDDTCGAVSDEDVVNIAASTDDQQHESDDDTEEGNVVGLQDAQSTLRTVLAFFVQRNMMFRLTSLV